MFNQLLSIWKNSFIKYSTIVYLSGITFDIFLIHYYSEGRFPTNGNQTFKKLGSKFVSVIIRTKLVIQVGNIEDHNLSLSLFLYYDRPLWNYETPLKDMHL